MKARSISAAILTLAIGALVATPALSQVSVTVQNPSFSWTGKSGQQANYRWSATINNPSGRELNLRVTLELLDNSGSVVGSDSTTVMVAKEDRGSVERTASVAYASAERAARYRIVLANVE